MAKTEGAKGVARALAIRALTELRRRPWLHRPSHAVAVRLSRYRPVARLIQAVLEPQYLTTEQYVAWVERYDTLSDADRRAIAAHVERFAYRPLISVIMPAYETEPRFLREAIASVRDQLYPNWELCVADDASPSPHVWEILQEEAARDPRIKIARRDTNGHISAASNTALGLATGEFVALMDHDDRLAEHALYEVAAELQAHPDADMIYSDEDKIDEKGRRFEPYFKTGWNPELLLGQNMVSHLGVYRRELLTRIGGFREGFEGSQDYDLALRASEATTPDRIRHIPAVLYHWRQQTGSASFSEADIERCAAAAERAVSEHLERTGARGAQVERHPDSPSWLFVHRAAPEPAPLVTVIVPTRDRAELLERCVEGVLQNTDYPAIELIIVDNGSVETRTKDLMAELAKDPRVRVLDAPGPFNYSQLNNDAVREARGEILLLLNNDVAVIEPGWLTEMVSHAVRAEVGAVGARLLYADGRVQHGGIILGVGGDPPVAGNLYAGAPATDRGYYSHLRLTRNMSAVTAACLALRKAVFEEVGGLDAEHLAVAFNDVDLCLKIRSRGYQVVWTPRAELHHLESASRGSDSRPDAVKRFAAEIAYMRERWGEVLDNDPFYGPNFDPKHGDYRLASPPRRVRPWTCDAA